MEAHVAAFAFLGGCPARIVLDNLRAGVVRPDLYDPKLNRAYAELGAHHGVILDPARAGKPKDKARCERQMPYVRDSFFAGREFVDLASMREAAATERRHVPECDRGEFLERIRHLLPEGIPVGLGVAPSISLQEPVSRTSSLLGGPADGSCSIGHLRTKAAELASLLAI